MLYSPIRYEDFLIQIYIQLACLTRFVSINPEPRSHSSHILFTPLIYFYIFKLIIKYIFYYHNSPYVLFKKFLLNEIF